MNSPYGLLIKAKDLLLHRNYFNELVKMIGVQTLYRAPRPGKSYTIYSEIDSNYFEPEQVGCIFEEHPNPKTMKTLGWNTELENNPALISVPYDLKGLQKGALFEIPDTFNPEAYRLFRVNEISGIMIYPASLTCQLIPEFNNSFSNNLLNHRNNSFNLLNREDYD